MIDNPFLPHILLWFFTFVTSVLIAVFVWPRRNIKGGVYILGYSLSLAEWTLAGTFEAMVINPQTKVLLAKIEYMGFVLVVPFAYLFVRKYVSNHKFSRAEILTVFLIPLITAVLAWTNEYHHFLWSSFAPGDPALNILIYGHGPWFYVNATYIYLLVIFSVIQLIRAYTTSQRAFRQQVAAILFAFAFPVVICTTYLLNIVPVPGMDTTATGFAITGLIITFAIFRLKLLDLLPVAHQTVFNEMRDGVIVVDDKNRLVDINPAAQRFMLIKGQEAVGQPVMDFLPKTLAGLFETKSDRISSYEMLAKDQKTYVNVYAVPLKAKKNQPSGTLITLQDITNYKQAEMKLKESNIQLQKELQHIEVLQESLQAQALRDPLTNLYNRRYQEEILDREISRAQRLKTPISVMMIDFDNFKQVNDHYSHQAGDQTLVAFAAILNETSRREDITCRYGGDEFLLIMPGLSREDALARGEFWRKRATDADFFPTQGDKSITISIGISSFPENGATAGELVQAADKAMYSAKQEGKNLVRLAEPSKGQKAGDEAEFAGNLILHED